MPTKHSRIGLVRDDEMDELLEAARQLREGWQDDSDAGVVRRMMRLAMQVLEDEQRDLEYAAALEANAEIHAREVFPDPPPGWEHTQRRGDPGATTD